MKKEDKPIIVEQTFEASVEAVWNSITRIDQMRQWYFENIPEFKPEVGFETQFNVQSGGRDFVHMWKVTEVAPLKRIAYSWKYPDFEGAAIVVFDLSSGNQRTMLRLTLHVLEDFPQTIPEFARESCIQGWEFFIANRLKHFLEGRR